MKKRVSSVTLALRKEQLLITAVLNSEGEKAFPSRLGLLFQSGELTRRMPLPLIRKSESEAVYETSVSPYHIFYPARETETELVLLDENGAVLSPENAESLDARIIVGEKGIFLAAECMKLKATDAPASLKERLVNVLFRLLNICFRFYRKRHTTVNHRVSFMSGRRMILDGNLLCVYDALKGDSNTEIKTLLFSQNSGKQLIKNAFAFMRLYATSRVVVVDDYFRLLNYFDKPENTEIIQLWHACGAFKTFGFSRIGKPGGPAQSEVNHRMYDYASVSAAEVARHYAEGFGISDACVLPLGVPRTDCFFDAQYKAATQKKFYEAYPALKGKKLLLFAPTFRGKGQQSAYYPMERLNLQRLCDALGEDWAVLLKLHPFCRERFTVEEALQGRVLDLSDKDELNDLLFITDLLVTDYSSAVFEASLLNIPMLFYAFDLEEYIGARDFYYPYEQFVPGKIVTDEEALYRAVRHFDADTAQTAAFRERFFDATDGNASERVAALIKRLIGEEI